MSDATREGDWRVASEWAPFLPGDLGERRRCLIVGRRGRRLRRGGLARPTRLVKSDALLPEEKRPHMEVANQSHEDWKPPQQRV
jgi:hypothetical protein